MGRLFTPAAGGRPTLVSLAGGATTGVARDRSRPRLASPQPVRRVVVARLDNLGDVLLAGPAVRAVASSGAHVTFLCGPAGAPGARLLPGVDRVEVWDAPWVGQQPGPVDPPAVSRLVGRMRDLAPAQVAVLTSFHQSPLPLALLLRLAGVPRIAAVSVDYPGALLDHRLAYDAEAHEVEQNLAVVAALGYHPDPDDDGALAVMAPRGRAMFHRPYVVVHPGASVPARGLPPERVGAIVDALMAAGWLVVRSGSLSEATALPLPARDGLVDLAGRTSLPRLASVLAGAAAVVCGNTGVAHLAAAVGTPVVSVFAPVVDARRCQPWGVPFRLLGHQAIACGGCRSRVCPVPGQPCLDPVTPSAVVEAVAELVGDGAGRPGRLAPRRIPARPADQSRNGRRDRELR